MPVTINLIKTSYYRMTIEEFTNDFMSMKQRLYRLSLSIVGSAMVAEDVVQEVMIKVWNKRIEAAKIENKPAWVMKMTRNLSIDKLRSKHAKTQGIPEGYDVVNKTHTPETITQSNDTVSKIHGIMAQLPKIQRMCIQLRDIEEMKYQEIADILEISIDQVKVNIYRARNYIKKEFLKTDSYGV